MGKVVLTVCMLICGALGSLLEDQVKWNNFKVSYSKKYESSDEESNRFSIFQENLRKIEAHNHLYETGATTYKMGVTKFTDQTYQEFSNFLKRSSQSKPRVSAQSHYLDDLEMPVLPNATDWRDSGYVTPVKNQGACGSCWAFSVVGSLEGFYGQRYKEVVAFSAQQLVDCDTSNDGCVDGDEAPAFQYFVDNGIETEETYPYVGEKQECKYQESDVYAWLEDYVPIPQGEEETIHIVTGFLGPVSVAIDASGLPFYASGIFRSDTCSNTTTNHAVITIGYDRDDEKELDYWIIKNSWGADWGEDGFFRIERGVNMCAIAMNAIYPSFGIQPN